MLPGGIAAGSSTGVAGNDKHSKKTGNADRSTAGNGDAVLWREPEDITSRRTDLGPGGEEHQPKGPFQFVKEDAEGSNPKFTIKDQDGVKWKVKLGEEARPETAATRLVWAVGYFTDEDYFVPNLEVANLPDRLRRAPHAVQPMGIVHDARLERSRDQEKKLGIWQWSDNPFLGTREFNGLRTLMAVINNWDLKDINNAVYERKGPSGPERIYVVTDLGATFGTSGFGWTKGLAKGNLDSYQKSKFIRNITAEYVDFNVPDRPALDHFPDIPRLKLRLDMRKIGWQVPRADARWMGELLGRLSGDQIRNVFRVSGWGPYDVEAFAVVIEDRIRQLKAL